MNAVKNNMIFSCTCLAREHEKSRTFSGNGSGGFTGQQLQIA